ncbi:hypothetical protein BB560_001590 [Smittium megazygosporum]|uniref:Uncharacterized protein n=1 Tax=Smittium megazygosporum TaxID=133381 RepID=A0A2T9ZH51_9FUNG|nr:hypothetical protein BB560_001590 [Smittium megazygosporum]
MLNSEISDLKREMLSFEPAHSPKDFSTSSTQESSTTQAAFSKLDDHSFFFNHTSSIKSPFSSRHFEFSQKNAVPQSIFSIKDSKYKKAEPNSLNKKPFPSNYPEDYSQVNPKNRTPTYRSENQITPLFPASSRPKALRFLYGDIRLRELSSILTSKSHLTENIPRSLFPNVDLSKLVVSVQNQINVPILKIEKSQLSIIQKFRNTTEKFNKANSSVVSLSRKHPYKSLIPEDSLQTVLNQVELTYQLFSDAFTKLEQLESLLPKSIQILGGDHDSKKIYSKLTSSLVTRRFDTSNEYDRNLMLTSPGYSEYAIKLAHKNNSNYDKDTCYYLEHDRSTAAKLSSSVELSSFHMTNVPLLPIPTEKPKYNRDNANYPPSLQIETPNRIDPDTSSSKEINEDMDPVSLMEPPSSAFPTRPRLNSGRRPNSVYSMLLPISKGSKNLVDPFIRLGNSSKNTSNPDNPLLLQSKSPILGFFPVSNSKQSVSRPQVTINRKNA